MQVFSLVCGRLGGFAAFLKKNNKGKGAFVWNEILIYFML